jgi:outer membrane protein OmpA-like peptidoglycan-associated protein
MPEQMAETDTRLKNAARMLESNQTAEARQQGPALIEAYANLELSALKSGLTEAAEQAVQQAEEAEAEDYAPRTLRAAREELQLVHAVLESDRTQRDKAERHARKAIWLARRAQALTELAMTFEQQDYGHEDILLWHQDQLKTVGEPLDTELPFDESDRAAVSTLRDGIESLLGALASARATNEDNQERIAALQTELEETHTRYQDKLAELAREQQDQLAKIQTASASQLRKLQKETKDRLATVKKEYEEQLSAEARARAEAERQRKQAEQRYEQVQSLFSEDEALVSRHGDNVRIDVYGFDFKPGESDIGSRNFGLLHRVLSAINEFPDSKVRIEGHTDARGSEDRNLRLSINRAAAVESFLTDVGGIAPTRVESDGYGESKPVAPNDSAEGRAKNRRISVLIINDVDDLEQKPPEHSPAVSRAGRPGR